jgi:hypothetical protein
MRRVSQTQSNVVECHLVSFIWRAAIPTLSTKTEIAGQ